MIESLLSYFTHIFSFNQNSPLLFTQFYFWAFFALVFAVFSLIHNKFFLRNSFLFFVSLFFYYKTSGSYVLILIFTVLLNYYIARAIHLFDKKFFRLFFLFWGVALNLFTLSYFKYSYFFLDLLHKTLGVELQIYNFFAAGTNYFFKTHSLVDQIILPVGISFFTFQAISYIVDVYRKIVLPVNRLLDFGFYLTFFPQLVAGPIVRANKFIPQLYKKSVLPRRTFGLAIFWILNGLAKKIIMSDYLATNFVDRVFETPLLFTGFENLLALFAYSLQVYADFSGYTDIAIGVALLMGFHLPQNFNSPYKAINPAGFWRRWHMSLSTWLRDYLYIPLGGNRRASVGTFFWIAIISLVAIILSRSFLIAFILAAFFIGLSIYAYFNSKDRRSITTQMNNMTTMLLGGLWHGASWNFMIWGGLNGAGMILHRLWVRFPTTLRAFIMFVITAACLIINKYSFHPLLSIIGVWSGIILIGIYLGLLYSLFSKKKIQWIFTVWNVFLTFVFITFTRLFFRSGSNLDPVEANETAWETATNMIRQIGSPWSLKTLPNMIMEYKNIILVFALGMIIHWLPDRFKRLYRYYFASAPLVLQMFFTIIAIFIIYQFMSADSQPFIYFQF